VVLTWLVAALRSRVTTTWIRRINLASGLAIWVFAMISIGSVVL
jgi:hypothetical protein